MLTYHKPETIECRPGLDFWLRKAIKKSGDKMRGLPNFALIVTQILHCIFTDFIMRKCEQSYNLHLKEILRI